MIKIKLKKQVKGITLVALVVTIIVLLILSGVAINLSIGEDGIFRRAQEGAKVYQNASENEKIELDKVSNYIDDYLNGNNKEDEEEKLSEVEEAIKNGTVYENNTTIYDKYSNPVKVPAGFKLAQDSGTDVTKGIVIEDAEAGDEISKGNQYIWVPIGDVKYNANGDIKTINLGRYSFDARYNSDTQQLEGTGTTTMRQSADNYIEVVEIDVGQSYKYIEKTSGASNTIAKDLGDFITKAKNAGGYYIGRYEAGKVDGNTDTFNIKKGQEVYSEINQLDAATLARNLYSSNNNFESDLINSYAWDTAIVYIQTFSGDTDYSLQSRFQSGITITGNAHDEENNYDVRCNIYDIAGNVREWSTETYTDNLNPSTSRGADYITSTSFTAHRTFNSTSYEPIDISFRSILYL